MRLAYYYFQARVEDYSRGGGRKKSMIGKFLCESREKFCDHLWPPSEKVCALVNSGAKREKFSGPPFEKIL